MNRSEDVLETGGNCAKGWRSFCCLLKIAKVVTAVFKSTCDYVNWRLCPVSVGDIARLHSSSTVEAFLECCEMKCVP